MKLKKKKKKRLWQDSIPGTSRLLEMYFTTALICKLKYSDEIKIYNESILNTREDNTFSKQKQWCIKIIIYAYFCLFSASKVIMPYGKLITRFTTGGHDIFITCPAKSMHLEPFGLSVHAFCGTGDENIIPTCRSAGNYYSQDSMLALEGIFPSVFC